MKENHIRKVRKSEERKVKNIGKNPIYCAAAIQQKENMTTIVKCTMSK